MLLPSLIMLLPSLIMQQLRVIPIYFELNIWYLIIIKRFSNFHQILRKSSGLFSEGGLVTDWKVLTVANIMNHMCWRQQKINRAEHVIIITKHVMNVIEHVMINEVLKTNNDNPSCKQYFCIDKIHLDHVWWSKMLQEHD